MLGVKDRNDISHFLFKILQILSVQEKKFMDLQIPRKYFLDKLVQSVELHTFNDVSEFALSAVCYIRVEYSDQSFAVRFVIGKARVAS